MIFGNFFFIVDFTIAIIYNKVIEVFFLPILHIYDHKRKTVIKFKKKIIING